MIPTITLGDNLTVSKLGFGGMAVTDTYGSTPDEVAKQAIHTALDAGITFIDTADVYGEPRPNTTGPAGTNEELIGEVLATTGLKRDEIQLATKFGIVGFDLENGMSVRGDREYVREACHNSLRRLGVDHIDLYYMHRRELTRPIEETVTAMAELVAEGKVRHIGLSEVTADELRAAHRIHPITAVQSEWSIWSRDVEHHVVPAASELGVGFVPYSPLGRGFLTGTLQKDRVQSSILAAQPRYDQHYDDNQAIVATIQDIAAECEATAAQVALAWLWHQGTTYGLPVVPIPGSRRSDRIHENAAAVDVHLTEEHMARLDAALITVYGGRNFTFTDDDWISSGRE